jgi:acetolactate synthase-1/2/3 large subunit
MGPDFLFVPGSSGACSEVAMQAFQNKAGQRVLNSEGLGPMGFGIPAALGACLASGGRPTVCVDGDGGFAMNIQELASVARLDLPIKYFVLDNNGYGSIRTTSDNYFEGRKVGCDEESGLRIPDYMAVGPAMGLPTARVDGVDGLSAVIGRTLMSPGPELVVVKVSEKQRTRPRVTSRRAAGGGMETSPLEFLSPSVSALDVTQELSRPLSVGSDNAEQL